MNWNATGSSTSQREILTALASNSSARLTSSPIRHSTTDAVRQSSFNAAYDAAEIMDPESMKRFINYLMVQKREDDLKNGL